MIYCVSGESLEITCSISLSLTCLKVISVFSHMLIYTGLPTHATHTCTHANKSHTLSLFQGLCGPRWRWVESLSVDCDVVLVAHFHCPLVWLLLRHGCWNTVKPLSLEVTVGRDVSGHTTDVYSAGIQWYILCIYSDTEAHVGLDPMM